jgi:hypothetical protein
MLLTSCLLLAAIASGQHFSPKRIVYNNDSLVCFSYKQELDLLRKIKLCNGVEIELTETRSLWEDCNKQLTIERKYYKDLTKLYTDLETEADSLRTKYQNEVTLHANTKALLETETNRKRNWRMAAIAEGIIIVAIFLVK